jgi:hypothetical protein
MKPFRWNHEKMVHPVDAYFLDKKHQQQNVPSFKYKFSRRLIEPAH